MQKPYPIISVCKEDILQMYESREEYNQAMKIVEKFDDSDMETIANKLANDYCEQMFGGSLQTIFEEYFWKDANETKQILNTD